MDSNHKIAWIREPRGFFIFGLKSATCKKKDDISRYVLYILLLRINLKQKNDFFG